MLRVSVVLLSVLAAAVYASAQQQTAPHPLSNLPPSGAITTAFHFPDHANKKFPAGDTIKVVLGIHNDSPDLFNITAVLGSLNMVADFNQYIQNFTEQVYHQPVLGGQEVSVEYKFVPDRRIPGLGSDTRDFVVALTVLYQDQAGKYMSNTFFNQTISIVEVKQLIDWELISLFLILGGLVAGGAYLLYSFTAPHLQSLGFVRKGKRSKKVETSKADSQDEWVKGTTYDNFQKRKAAAAAKKQAAE